MTNVFVDTHPSWVGVMGLVRQVAPVLRVWLRDHVLTRDAGEVMQTALTFSMGIFSRQPTLLAEALEEGGRSGMLALQHR